MMLRRSHLHLRLDQAFQHHSLLLIRSQTFVKPLRIPLFYPCTECTIPFVKNPPASETRQPLIL